MEEKVSIEEGTADGFLRIYNKEHRRTFKIVRLADSPDVECKDNQGKPLNLEITLTEDRPGDIPAALGRSQQRSPEALREHLECVRDGKAKPLERTSSLGGNVSDGIISRIRPKLLKRYGAHTALVIRDTSGVDWDWDWEIPELQKKLAGVEKRGRESFLTEPFPARGGGKEKVSGTSSRRVAGGHDLASPPPHRSSHLTPR